MRRLVLDLQGENAEYFPVQPKATAIIGIIPFEQIHSQSSTSCSSLSHKKMRAVVEERMGEVSHGATSTSSMARRSAPGIGDG